MSIRYAHRYTREEIRANPDTLYIFGDNFACAGYGGQAREARGEPNAVGIPTKNTPDNGIYAFVTDRDLPRMAIRCDSAFKRLKAHVASGGDVVMPANGIGTGLAEMPTRAPRCWSWLCERLQELGIRNGTALGRDGERAG